jgi:hypothetical protein
MTPTQTGSEWAGDALATAEVAFIVTPRVPALLEETPPCP